MPGFYHVTHNFKLRVVSSC